MIHNGFKSSLKVVNRLQSRLYSSTLRKPQFDIKTIIKNIPRYENSVKYRELVAENTLLSGLSELPGQNEQLRELRTQMNKIQRERREIESEIKQKRVDVRSFHERLVVLKSQYQDCINKISQIDTSIEGTILSLPNLLHDSVPLDGKPEIVQWINKPKDDTQYPQSSDKRDHVSIMTRKGLLDLRRAASASGTSSYYLINEAARLEMALINYAIDFATKRGGFQLVAPPSLARLEVIDACGFRPRDMNGEKQIYAIEGRNVGLIATSEITLAAMGLNDTIDFHGEKSKRVVGVSRCYRAEAGSRGRDTRGLYRVHEFNKVEMFCWSRPEDSDALLEELKSLQIDIIDSLGLYAKVLNIPSNDLGNPAYKKYDIEVWMPGRGSFGEVSSASNCTDFQSRRLNTKFRREDGKLEYVHTLNGTAMAVPRVLLAIVENFYDPETDLISVPGPLRPYMGNKEYI